MTDTDADSKVTTNDLGLEPAKLIWDEYKYRHEHCWKLLFQITAAVVIVSIIPYTQVNVGQKLKGWIVILPLVGMALTLFGLKRLDREMKILETIRNKHRERQNNLHHMGHGSEGSLFGSHVKAYLVFILALELVNIMVLLLLWIPRS